jgi:hypothetical protein
MDGSAGCVEDVAERGAGLDEHRFDCLWCGSRTRMIRRTRLAYDPLAAAKNDGLQERSVYPRSAVVEEHPIVAVDMDCAVRRPAEQTQKIRIAVRNVRGFVGCFGVFPVVW